MNDSNKDTEINAKKGKKLNGIESEDGKKKYDIEIVDEMAKFKKDQKGEEADIKAKVKVYEKGTDDKFPKDPKDEGEKTIKVSYGKGTMWSNLEIKEIIGEKVKSGKTFGGSYHWPFWTMIVVIAILLIGGIAWWVMASRKEDKEEGDL